MRRERKALTANAGFLRDAWKRGGLAGVVRKVGAALRMSLPSYLLGRRTHSSVGAFYDLVTDEARLFYGDSFHFGYFRDGVTTLRDAVDALTDLVAEMASPGSGDLVDLGCGICAPAARLARLYPTCRITGVNISAEQVRQARQYVGQLGLADRVQVVRGNALALDFPEGRFDAALSLEVAANVCVDEAEKRRHVAEMFRVLKPGGRVGFADLVFRGKPSSEDDAVMKRVFFHTGSEYVTDWPALFRDVGFVVDRQTDILPQTLRTWPMAAEVYDQRAEEVNRRYGAQLATRVVADLRRLPTILERFGNYLVLSARKPSTSDREARDRRRATTSSAMARARNSETSGCV